MTPIQEFYTGKTILATGATGYGGKVTLEKALRTLPGIKCIYILIRPKKGMTPEQRMKELISKIPFTFNYIDPNQFKKLVALEGDITKENLGLSERDQKRVINEVNIVLNTAASVRMDLSLKEAVITNTLSTLRVLRLAANMKNLVCAIHVSTTYCNIEIETMEEKVYKAHVDPYKVIDLVQWMDDKILKIMEKTFIKPHPNTYTFSKRLAEIIAYDMGKQIPVAIGRPSIIIPALNEPIPGWVDNFNGPAGLLAAAGKGVVRSVLADKNLSPQIVPVDIASNCAIIGPWLRATHPFTDTPVFNVTQDDIVQIPWKETIEKFRALGWEYPSKKMLWYPDADTTTNRLKHHTYVFLFQTIPAYIVDFLCIIFRQKPFLVNVQKRIAMGQKVLSYFSLRDFKFSIKNALLCYDLLDPEDRKIFYTRDVKYDVDDYIRNAFFTGRKYLVKEDLKNMHLYKMLLYFLYVLDRFCKFMFLYGVIWLVLRLFGATYLINYKYWFDCVV